MGEAKLSQHGANTSTVIWWMDSEYLIGRITHKLGGKVYIYYRNRYKDDATYALVSMEDEKPKLICTLWLGNISDSWID